MSAFSEDLWRAYANAGVRSLAAVLGRMAVAEAPKADMAPMAEQLVAEAWGLA